MRRTAGIVGLVLLLAGCGPFTPAPRPRPTPTPSAHRPSPAPTITVIRTGRVVRAGTTVPFQAQAGVSLRIRASKPSLSRRRLSSSYGYAPSRGYYVTFLVTMVNTGRRPIDIGPGDFFVQVSRQGKVTTLMGNAPYSGASAQLDATQLDAGQSLSGPLTFDVRAPHGTLAFAPDGSAAISWTY
ncbi:MAG: hypothetical protein QOD07_2686 [Frankiaceae bacterium]|jgi:hypothetical protein|nr:hypothetical protein [Frankiaceae bacterium]